MLPAHIPHQYAADESSPWNVYWLHFVGEEAAALRDRLQAQPLLHLKHEDLNELARLFYACFYILQGPLSFEEYFSVCQYGLSILSNTLLFSKRASNLLTEKGGAVIEAAIAFMQENVNRNVSLKEMAQAVGFSPSYFSGLFKAATQHSPVEYYLKMKMQAAGKELFFTERSVKEIASSYGIDDPCYFSRLFKHVMGMSPISYRNLLKG